MLYRRVKEFLGKLQEKHEEHHKEYKYLYKKMLEESTIRKAYKNLRKGKTKRKEIKAIDKSLDKCVARMKEMIWESRPGAEHPEKGFHPPKKRKPKKIHENGKDRTIYMPDMWEQWLHHIIVLVLQPIIDATAYRWSCGSFPGRGAHYGMRYLRKKIRTGKHIRNFVKIDIRHFYNSIRVTILIRELRIRIKDDWFIAIIERCLEGFKKGIPLGFYISQWLANYLLEPLDRFITEVLGIQIHERYMDDIVMMDDNKKKLHDAIAQIRMLIGRRFRLKLKDNYTVAKFIYDSKRGTIGRPIDFMGFVFMRNRVIIRESIMLSATRLAAHMYKVKERGGRYYPKHCRAMVSSMGWFKFTSAYGIYLERIKPLINIRKLKQTISKEDRRENSERMARGAQLCAA